MPRSCFDDTKGVAALSGYATPATQVALASAQNATRYLCHGAAGALFAFLEQVRMVMRYHEMHESCFCIRVVRTAAQS
jgi:hypothetical protein